MRPYNEDIPSILRLLSVKGVGPQNARKLINVFGSADNVFSAERTELLHLGKIGDAILEARSDSRLSSRIDQMINWSINNQIQIIHYGDEDYPYRLRDCIDAPLLLYFRGQNVLNRKYIVSVVGTRNSSHYGRSLAERLMKGLASLRDDMLIVSGLAYGTDINAHREALNNDIPTVGVLAHGLDRIYPESHRQSAIAMLEAGGLLTEYPNGTNPDRGNFLARNRIVAGMADATIVIESPNKGGSIVTANIADSYQREVMAFPGRVGDMRSEGCNSLIRRQKASMITSAEDLIEAMGWDRPQSKPIQNKIQFEGDNDSLSIVSLLQSEDELSLNQLATLSGLNIAQITSILMDMEMDDIVMSLPGKRYRLI